MQHFQKQFSSWKVLIKIKIELKFVPGCLVPKRWRTITRTNDDPVHWCIDMHYHSPISFRKCSLWNYYKPVYEDITSKTFLAKLTMWMASLLKKYLFFPSSQPFMQMGHRNDRGPSFIGIRNNNDSKVRYILLFKFFYISKILNTVWLNIGYHTTTYQWARTLELCLEWMSHDIKVMSQMTNSWTVFLLKIIQLTTEHFARNIHH